MSLILLFVLPLLYFTAIIYIQIASNYRIYPKHQDQSRRNRIVKGLGILFPIAWTIFMALNDFIYPVFTVGLWLAALFAFADDMVSVSPYIQMVIHLLALSSMFMELNLIQLPPAQLIMAYTMGFLILQSFQTMDGANGMIGGTAIAIVCSFILMDPNSWKIDISNPFLHLLFALLVFAFFNFRVKAIAFGGNIGRTTIALLLCFFLFQAMTGKTNFQDLNATADANTRLMAPQYFLFFAIFILDFFLVALKRMAKQKNPFTVEREQYFHTLKTRMGFPLITISLIYAILQFGVNLLVVIFL